MKLLHVISSLEIGGAQRLLSDLLPIQRQQGLDVSLLVYEDVDNDFTKKVKEAGVPILSLGVHAYRDPRNILRIRRVIRDYDVVHVHLFPSLYWVALASVGLPCRLVYTEHSTSNERRGKWYFRPIEKCVYRAYSKIIAISQQTENALCQWLGSHDERFVVINNGIALMGNQKRPLTTNPGTLIMISRFVAAKDHPTLLRAMVKLPHCQLLLVGDGERMQECRALAQHLQIQDRVQFLGTRTDVPQLLAQSGIGIQSSNWEGFGLTAVEMMAAGLPVVVSDVDGLKQVVEGAGLCFRQGDADDLAEKVKHLLDDPVFYQHVSNACQAKAKEYDIHKMAERYKQQYKCITE